MSLVAFLFGLATGWAIWHRRDRFMPLTYVYTDDEGKTNALLFAHSQAWFDYVKDRAETIAICAMCGRGIRPGRWYWRSLQAPDQLGGEILFGLSSEGDLDLCVACGRIVDKLTATRSPQLGYEWRQRLQAAVANEQRTAHRVLSASEVRRIATRL